MGGNKLLILALVSIMMISLVSAEIEMRRSHTFYIGEEKTYTFIDEDYDVRVMQSIPGFGGKADIRINDRKFSVRHDSPVFYGDLIVSLTEAAHYNATLSMVWTKEVDDYDYKAYINANRKYDLDINEKLFKVQLISSDSVMRTASFVINEEAFTLAGGEKYVLKDKSIVKITDLIFDTTKAAQIMIWASDEKITHDEEIPYDLIERMGENERTTFDIGGTAVTVAVLDVKKDRTADVEVDGETFSLAEDESAVTTSGIQFMISQIAMKTPWGLMISILLPQNLVSEKTEMTLDKNMNENEKGVFELDDYTLDVRMIAITETGVEFELNGKLLNLDVGKEARVGDVWVLVKGVTPNAHPPKAMFTFTVPVEPEPVKVPEEPEEETEEPVACTMDVMECPDGSFVGRIAPDCKFRACPEPAEPEETPEDVEDVVGETPEEPEEMPEEKPPAYTGEPIFVKNLKAIGGFFTGFVSWLF